MPTTVLDDPGLTIQICGTFLLVVAPLYLLFRYFVGIVRQAYGFDPSPLDGRPLRICGQCHNTVMEDDFSCCPYCGATLPPPPDGRG